MAVVPCRAMVVSDAPVGRRCSPPVTRLSDADAEGADHPRVRIYPGLAGSRGCFERCTARRGITMFYSESA